MKRALFATLIGGLTFASCSTEDNSVNEVPQLEVPETYSFTRDGASTVAYDGQTTRLLMSKELISSFTDFEAATAQSLSNMFSNEENPFSLAELNESSKSIKSKVAASKAYFGSNSVESNAIRDTFEAWITEQANEVFVNEGELAAPGVAGQIAQGDRTRYVNPKGVELNQLFAKSLIGALVTDQILNNYLSPLVLDEADNISNNEQDLTEEGEVYTTMEHKWDEAYGYLYGDPTIPTADPMNVLNESEDRLLFNYLGRVDDDADFSGIAAETFEAFKTGRAAIVAGDYELRDEQIAVIRENLSLVSAVRAVHYLQGGKNAIADANMGAAFHELSEGLGFLYSLRFSHNPETGEPYIEPSQLAAYHQELLSGDGFWEVTPETLDTISQDIADAFGFSVAEAAE